MVVYHRKSFGMNMNMHLYRIKSIVYVSIRKIVKIDSVWWPPHNGVVIVHIFRSRALDRAYTYPYCIIMTRTTSIIGIRVGSRNAKCFSARDFPQRWTDTWMTRPRRRLFKPVCRWGKSIVDDDVRRGRGVVRTHVEAYIRIYNIMRRTTRG